MQIAKTARLVGTNFHRIKTLHSVSVLSACCQSGSGYMAMMRCCRSSSGISSSSVFMRKGTLAGVYMLISTGANPRPMKPSSLAAARERSRMYFLANGPRSVTSTITSLSFLRLRTFSRVPKGSFRWAHVMLSLWYGSPLLILLPCRASW